MRIRGALHCTLDEAKGKQGHLFLGREELRKAAFKMLNEKSRFRKCVCARRKWSRNWTP